MKSGQSPLHLCIIGSSDFGRRVSAVVTQSGLCDAVFYGTLIDSWSMILTQRPNVVIFEVGPHFSARQHAWLRKILHNLHERSGNEIYVIVALTASEVLAFGGDLLFSNSSDLAPSEWIDAFIAAPPANMPSVPSVAEQLTNVLSLLQMELKRRADGQIALPRLGHHGWVQSLADPQSRELWMRWLPRYASYINENPIIIGETGTGKTRLAYALHILSGRPGQFVSITPRDFSSSELVQAELFGAVAGAYTGAVDKWGLVKSAEKGTLFIDELQSIDKDLQGKLITFIENKEYRRVGSAEKIEADVRFVFASNKSIPDMIESGILREDFAYRLERVQLELVPLKRRPLDVAPALAFGLAKIQRQRPKARAVQGLLPQAYRVLFCNSWPGNLRQLENVTAQLCELADIEEQDVIDESIVGRILGARVAVAPLDLADVIVQAADYVSRSALQYRSGSLKASIDKFIEMTRVGAIEACAGDLGKAAAMLDENEQLLQLVISKIQKQRETGYLE
ncbi:MAG: sigma-54-dependent Fis family transcriptional regulator [Deltaproteobacteria bacterium]|nr:sigma-54-dependent Fis family transcriptional regulator [Deltaproteobacteria bacterium]